ncbi:MAG TPA: hypothetical protein VF268_00230, partial [Gammaproteobacteria bacterium]
HTTDADGSWYNAVFHDFPVRCCTLQVAEINMIVFLGGVSIRGVCRIQSIVKAGRALALPLVILMDLPY